MRKKEQHDRAVHISVTLTPQALAQLDGNVDRLQAFLVSKGVPEKDVVKVVSRSSLIAQVAKELGTERGFNAVKGAFELVLGLDQAQQDLFIKDTTGFDAVAGEL